MKTLTNVLEVEGILETKPAGVEAKPRYHWDYAAKISTQRRSQWSGCPTTSSVEDVPNVFGWPPSDSKRNSRQMVDGSCPKILGDPTITLFLFHSFHWFDGNFGANVDIFMWGLILKHVLCFSSYQLEATKTLIGAFVWRTSTPSLPRALQMKNPNQKQVMRTLTWDSKRQKSPWHRRKAQNRVQHHLWASKSLRKSTKQSMRPSLWLWGPALLAMWWAGSFFWQAQARWCYLGRRQRTQSHS